MGLINHLMNNTANFIAIIYSGRSTAVRGFLKLKIKVFVCCPMLYIKFVSFLLLSAAKYLNHQVAPFVLKI
jgi:hypothetical protein